LALSYTKKEFSLVSSENFSSVISLKVEVGQYPFVKATLKDEFLLLANNQVGVFFKSDSSLFFFIFLG
jgi:hypothetical protein